MPETIMPRKKKQNMPAKQVGGVPAAEPGVTYLTKYDQERMAQRDKYIQSDTKRKNLMRAITGSIMGDIGRVTKSGKKKLQYASEEDVRRNVRTYVPQPALAFADTAATDRYNRRNPSRSRRQTILGGPGETLG